MFVIHEQVRSVLPMNEMLWHILLLFVCLQTISNGFITYIAIRLPLKGFRAAPGAPWPQPHTWQNSSNSFAVDVTNFHFDADMKSCDVISEAIKRYKTIIAIEGKADVSTSATSLSSLSISVESGKCEQYPHLNMNESYLLEVNDKAVLKAGSVWGILRGLETFSQLLYRDETQMVRINKTRISDKPRFKYRGLMLDTARHFIPVPLLLKNLDAMAYNKMNVFHWHMVDDQSFPYESIKFPELSKKGAFSSRHVYSQDDVKIIIQYARLRGIRVIPEFDTPGHTQSWGKAFKDLLTPCWVGGEEGKALPDRHGAYEIFNPMNNFTFTFLEDFFTEIRNVFPDPFVHLGMDEAYPYCWQSSPNISEFMKENYIKDFTELEQYYVRRVLQIVKQLNQSYIIWQDPVEHGAVVQQDTVIEVWKGNETTPWTRYMENLSKKGYPVILSSCWYLNYISYGQDWKNYYQCEPLSFNGTQDQYDNVIGGEACLWSEYVDGTNLLSRLWPRASAVAERLWSPRSIDDVDSAKFRLDQQRCRMLRRGIPAEPILDGYCGDYEAGFETDHGIYKPEIHIASGGSTCLRKTQLPDVVLFLLLLANCVTHFN